MSKKTSMPKNMASRTVIDATGYTPYVLKRAELMAINPEVKGKSTLMHMRTHWLRDEAITDMKNYVSAHDKLILQSKWQCENDKRGFNGRIKWEMDKYKEKIALLLEERRMRLKELLLQEEQMYFAEKRRMRNPPENSQQQKLDRYKELLIQKEMERCQIAKEKTEQQFRINCEELRPAIRKKLDRMYAEEAQTIATLRDREAVKRTEEGKFFEEACILDIQAKERRENEIERLRKESNKQFGKDLREQIDGKYLPKSFAPSINMELQLMDEQTRLLALEKEWDLAEKKQKQKVFRKGLDECMEDRLKRRAKEEKEGLLLDYYFLEQILKNDYDEQKAAIAKDELRQEQDDYLNYIREEINRVGQFEREVERMQKEESDKMWEKREKQWEADKRLRNKLNKRVIELCREQIKNKKEKCRLMEERKMEGDKEILKDVELYKVEEAQKKRETREKNIHFQSMVWDQIKSKAEAEKEVKVQERKEVEDRKERLAMDKEKIRQIIAESSIQNLHPYRIPKS